MMIKTVNLQKIFKTEEVETWALNNVSKHSASCVFFSPLFLPTFVASL